MRRVRLIDLHIKKLKYFESKGRQRILCGMFSSVKKFFLTVDSLKIENTLICSPNDQTKMFRPE